jgi:hypothetical protein
MQSTEPGPLLETKLTDELSVTLWDTWKIDAKGKSLKEMIAAFEAKYKGIEIRDVMQGNTPVYFSAIMNAPGKEKEKEKTLKKSIVELLDLEEGEPYVDLTVICIKKGDQEQKILEGVPGLRVNLKK